jgi:hypothetical protein
MQQPRRPWFELRTNEVHAMDMCPFHQAPTVPLVCCQTTWHGVQGRLEVRPMKLPAQALNHTE